MIKICYTSNFKLKSHLNKESKIISLKNINKTYPNGFCALKNINLEIKRNDIAGIIGYSGAGKSTLIRILNRLEEPTSGEVLIDGVDILALNSKQLQKKRQQIGMIFQHFNLLNSRDVFGNIAFALEIAKWDKSAIEKRVYELLELVGLESKAHFYPSQLSGGQKQRVAIARALANNPKLLLCDEATSALDAKTTKSILALLKELQSKLSLTIVLITHQIEVVQQICNKVFVIENGEIVESGAVIDVFSNPTKHITKELVGFISEREENVIAHLKDFRDIYRVIFTGPNAHNPLISQVIKEFGIDINILGGNIQEFNSNEIGYLVLRFLGEKTKIIQSLEWLKEKGVLLQQVSLEKYDSLNKEKK
ncbi:ABC transporter, ATP-binding protein [Helicobacter canadensis MIT 98-5491]|nr:ABC transporter, ATP-binding protein [Helicobacter canadensis MIT 98-5491]STO99493.1 DL-methionine transporter ATP-binding subunit [Helicobacter canadensis]